MPMFKILLIQLLLALAILTAPASVQAQAPFCDTRIVGYYPDYRQWSLPPADIRYDKLTHIMYFSLSPNADGTIDSTNVTLSNLQSMEALAHANNVKVSVCVGGWGRSTHFSAMAGNATSRANFVANLTQYCLDNALDGVDIDWEPVSNAADRNRYTTLIQDLKTALSPHSLTLSIAVAAWGSEFNVAAIPSIDWINIMAYDMGIPHSSYANAVSTLSHWESYGFTRDKETLGVPFYGKKPDNSAYIYKTIIDTYAPGPAVDLVDDINFNGINTIKQKTDFVINNNYGGIMIWEIAQDSFDATSLLTAINDTMHELLPADFDCNDVVGPTDMMFLVSYWLDTTCNTDNNWCDRTDLDLSGKVNLADYAKLAREYYL